MSWALGGNGFEVEHCGGSREVDVGENISSILAIRLLARTSVPTGP